VLGDALGSIGALASGVVIALWGWTPIDAIASLFICALIVFSSLRLLREGLHALMEGVPLRVSAQAIGTELARQQGVDSVHDLHIWTLSGSRIALSAHIVTRDMAQTIRYWRDLLGLRLVVGMGQPGYRHYFFELSKHDLIAFFDALHDMADPSGAARHAKESLLPDGGFTQFRRATETPFNIILKARP